MSKPIIIESFIGGQSRSLYDYNLNRFQTAQNLDIFSEPNILTPRINLGVATTSPVMSQAKLEYAHIASNGIIYFFGNSNTSNQLRIYKCDVRTTSTLTTVATGGSSTAPDQLSSYATEIRAIRSIAENNGYVLHWNIGGSTTLGRLKLSDESYDADPYSWAHGGTNVGPLFTHEGLGRTFIAVDNKVYVQTAATVSGTADPTLLLTLDPQYIIRSMCEYQRFALIAANPKSSNSGKGKIFIYDGFKTTVESIINVGDSYIQAIRNINGLIYILVANVLAGYPNSYVRTYIWNGGQVELVDEILLQTGTTTLNTGTNLPALIDDPAVAIVNNRLMFAMRAYTANIDNYVNVTNGIYEVGLLGGKVIRNLAFTTETTATDYSFTCLRELNGSVIAMFNNATNWYLEHQFVNATPGTKSSRGVYQSNIIPIGFQQKVKQIWIDHKENPSSSGFTLSIKHFGYYPKGSTVPVADSFTALTTSNGATDGSGSTTGKTQSTDNTTYTIIESPNVFKKANYIQLQIEFDEISTTNASSIIFPIKIIPE